MPFDRNEQLLVELGYGLVHFEHALANLFR